MDCSPPDSSVHGITPGTNTGVGYHFLGRPSDLIIKEHKRGVCCGVAWLLCKQLAALRALVGGLRRLPAQCPCQAQAQLPDPRSSSFLARNAPCPYSSLAPSLLSRQMCVCLLSCSVVSHSLRCHGLQPARLLCPWGVSRQEYCSGLPCPSPGDLSHPGIESTSLVSSALAGRFFTTEPPGKLTHTHSPRQNQETERRSE